MHTPPLETRRSSHLTRTPLIAIGPGGDYVTKLYAAGSRIVREPDPAPVSPPPPTVRRRLPTDPNRDPWRDFFVGLAMGILLGLLVLLGLLAWQTISHAISA